MNFDPQPLLLEGQHVRLEPLAPHHAAGLFEAGREPSIWRYLPEPPFTVPADAEKFIESAQKTAATGAEMPFATVRRSDGRVVGSTRFLDIRRPHRALEIGWTWINPVAQRTPINTEAKYLMLCHAFEQHGAIRVQLKTDERNAQSRAAITRLGAVFEGVLRNFQTRAHDGYVRNTAMFSITDQEWPAVKQRLEAFLAH